jgi:hypothetical protein
VALEHPQDRGDAIAAVRDGDKARLAKTLGAPPPHDALRVTIPADLLPIFARRAKAEAAIKQLEKASGSLREANVEPRHIESITDVIREVRLSQAYAMCGECNFTGRDEQGKPCPACNGKRYLTLQEFETAKQDRLNNLPKAK